jgi:hypothetical protein
MLRALFALAALFMLAGCDANDRRITLLKCDQTPLDENFKCPNIVKKGSDLGVLVNASTQKVQITTLESNGDFFPGTRIYENCSVVDLNNWKCTENSATGSGQFKMTMNNTYGMFRGHFYYTLESNQPPEYYTSSVGGWRRWMVEAGMLTYKQAQQYD